MTTDASRKLRALVLAGTAEARELCDQLSRFPQLQILASLAGAVSRPSAYAVPIRVGGFGGVEGLAEFIRSENFDFLVDATHPFAVQISCNAIGAADSLKIPIIRLDRPEWTPGKLDKWVPVDNLKNAVEMLPPRSIVLAALGGRSLGNPVFSDAIFSRKDVVFVVRTFERPALSKVAANCRVLVESPLSNPECELHLLRREKISCLLCRNSGGAGRLKLDAAAQLKLKVYMLSRPNPPRLPPSGISFSSVAELANWVAEQILEHGIQNGIASKKKTNLDPVKYPFRAIPRIRSVDLRRHQSRQVDTSVWF